MKQFVLDASVAVAWCFGDETTPFTEKLLAYASKGSVMFVSAFWPFEVANALLSAERRKRVTMAEVTTFLDFVSGFSIFLDTPQMTSAFDQVLALARQQNLTEYDAAYLELALRKNLPLATLDGDLRKAAQAVGVELAT